MEIEYIRNESTKSENGKKKMVLTWSDIDVIKTDTSFTLREGIKRTERTIIKNGKIYLKL
jgi:hypothetical protein